jgi:hypothetical protein
VPRSPLKNSDMARMKCSANQAVSRIPACKSIICGDYHPRTTKPKLVCCPENNMMCVTLKTARRQGATRARARCRCASQLRSNAGAGLFPAQPFGPQSFGRRLMLLARPVSRPIQGLRSRLGRRPNPKRRTPCYFRDSTLDPSDACRAVSAFEKGTESQLRYICTDCPCCA